jgi:hypothetical protein
VAGALSGCAILIRPNLALLAIAPLLVPELLLATPGGERDQVSRLVVDCALGRRLALRYQRGLEVATGDPSTRGRGC